MDQHSRVGQSIRGFFHLKLGPADFLSSPLSLVQNVRRFRDARQQFIYPRAHRAGRDEPLVAGRMTSDADRLLARANHFIARLVDGVIAVTLDAFAELPLVKRSFVRAGLKEFSLSPMARPADVRD